MAWFQAVSLELIWNPFSAQEGPLWSAQAKGPHCQASLASLGFTHLSWELMGQRSLSPRVDFWHPWCYPGTDRQKPQRLLVQRRPLMVSVPHASGRTESPALLGAVQDCGHVPGQLLTPAPLLGQSTGPTSSHLRQPRPGVLLYELS